MQIAIIDLGDLPTDFINMLIAVEDRAFFDHAGISITGIMRAATNNILAGRFAQGGSTLTQQLVKICISRANERLCEKHWRLSMRSCWMLDSRKADLGSLRQRSLSGTVGNRAIHGLERRQFLFWSPDK